MYQGRSDERHGNGHGGHGRGRRGRGRGGRGRSQEPGDMGPGQGRGGRGRGGRGGGGGRATWGNPEWRKQELARRAAEKQPNMGAADMARLITQFQSSGQVEQVVPEISSTADFRTFEEQVQAQGLHCKSYGKGKSTKVVISTVPLARHRASFDSEHLQSEQFGIDHDTFAAIKQCLRQFDAPGLPQNNKRRRAGTGEGPLLTLQAPQSGGPEEAESMRQEQQAYQSSAGARDMMAFRRKLPSFHARDEFLSAVENHQVVIVSGETGCGKTTQLPQMLLEDAIARGAGPATNIVCTQPRRISAVSIAQRVAQERGEALGSRVGYRIRLEAQASRATRLLFCTSGVLLRRLTVDEDISAVSHVIVDEIHERGVNEDLLLVILKAVMRRRPDLKVVLMSATLNAEKFAAFFPGAATVHIPGFTFPVNIKYLAEALTESGVTFKREEEGRAKFNPKREEARATPFDALSVDDAAHGLPAAAAASLRAWWATTAEKSATMSGKRMMQPPFVATFLEWLHTAHPSGAILVFCTGFDDIKDISTLLSAAQEAGRLPGAVVIPLHGSMPTVHQQSVFERPPPGQRKLLLSTNIAETSITIDDVEVVVDCGMQKIMSYDSLNKIRQLAPSWISQANAKQRSGRSGRVQEGACYRLYPREVFEQLAAHTAPEMQCMPLEAVVLQLKSIGIEAVRPFLGQAMDPPEEAAVQNAIMRLQAIGAMDASEALTPLGGHLQQLPVEPAVGRLLVMGAIFGCLEPVLTIAATLTLRSPFVMPMERRAEADAARRALAGRAVSDHWALLNAVDHFRRLRGERRHGELRDWCSRTFVVYNTMELICSLRLQLAEVLRDSGFLSNDQRGGERGNGDAGGASSGRSRGLQATIDAHSEHAHEPCLINAMLVAGLFPNVAAVTRRGMQPPKCFTDEDGRVAFHPSSILMGIQIPRDRRAWAVFTEKLMTTEIYLNTASEVSPGALLLFGGELKRSRDTLTVVDGFIDFNTDRLCADLITEMRHALDQVLQSKLEMPNTDVSQFSRPLIQASTELLRHH